MSVCVMAGALKPTPVPLHSVSSLCANTVHLYSCLFEGNFLKHPNCPVEGDLPGDGMCEEFPKRNPLPSSMLQGACGTVAWLLGLLLYVTAAATGLAGHSRLSRWPLCSCGTGDAPPLVPECPCGQLDLQAAPCSSTVVAV